MNASIIRRKERTSPPGRAARYRMITIAFDITEPGSLYLSAGYGGLR
ncbi:hypothetical protein T08_9751 [Trichinella sp. T8]|nr:hypothetical protein T08_9751 [Trichinella sp. T8]